MQTGTSKEDFVSLTQRIGRSTGGVGASRWVSTRRDGKGTAARLFVRGKAMPEKAGELLAIMTDVLTDARLDNRERIRQMALEGKAGFESSLAGMGNGIADLAAPRAVQRERLARRADRAASRTTSSSAS